MEALLYRRTIRREVAGRRTRNGTLGETRQLSAGARQTEFALSRLTCIAAYVATTIVAVIAAGHVAGAQELKHGEELLTRNCATCHAVGRSGESPNKTAPAFRTLGQRYPIESLEESLGEGIMSGHPDMPEFSFDAGDVGAIIAYLKSIQRR